MAQFSYSDYQDTIARAQGNGSANSSVKVGFFKLPKDGDEALVRINCAAIEDLKFATVHKPAFGKKFEGLGTGFTPVSCLNEVGSYSDACPFCRAAAEGHEVVGKAAKTVYLEMLVAYKDAQTGGWSAAQPVVWERPAGFSREIATKLRDYGSLKEVVFKVTRQGSGKDTKYSLDFIPLLNKPELVPTDFSAFDNFNINKHSYWEKSAADLEAYLATGRFPEVVKEAQPEVSRNLEKVIPNKVEEAKVEAALGIAPEATPAPVVEPAPASAPVAEEPKPVETPADRPARSFNGFSF